MALLEDLSQNYNPRPINSTQLEKPKYVSSAEDIETVSSLISAEAAERQATRSGPNLESMSIANEAQKREALSARKNQADEAASTVKLASPRSREEKTSAVRGRLGEKIVVRKLHQKREKPSSEGPKVAPHRQLKGAKSNLPFGDNVPQLRTRPSTRSGGRRGRIQLNQEGMAVPPKISPSHFLEHPHGGAEFEQTMSRSPLPIAASMHRRDDELFTYENKDQPKDRFPNDQIEFAERSDEFIAETPPKLPVKVHGAVVEQKPLGQDIFDSLDEALARLTDSTVDASSNPSDPDLEFSPEDALAAIEIEAKNLIRETRDPRIKKPSALLRKPALSDVKQVMHSKATHYARAIDSLIKDEPGTERNSIRVLNVLFCVTGGKSILSAINHKEVAEYANLLIEIPDNDRVNYLTDLFETLKHHFAGADEWLARRVQQDLNTIKGAKPFRKDFEMQAFNFWLKTQILST